MFLFIWLLFGIAAAIVASNKSRNGCGWFALGVLLGPFGLIFALVVSPLSPPSVVVPSPSGISLYSRAIFDLENKTCPQCANLIKLAAIKCPFCHTSFDPAHTSQAVAHRQPLIELARRTCPYCHSHSVDPNTYLSQDTWGPWCFNCHRRL